MKSRPGERLRERLGEARLAFERHHANAVPDAGFAARVAGRLTSNTAETIGWAAMRLLPASILLAIVLGYASLRAMGANEAAAKQGAENDVIAWLFDGGEPKR